MSFSTRLLAISALALSLTFGAPVTAMAGNHAAIKTTVAADTLSEKKRTDAGLYITAAEAADLLTKRDDVLLIDVRSPEETMFVGYPTETDVNIPFKFVDPAHAFNAKKHSYAMKANPGFADAAKAFLNGKDAGAVVVMCRSGSRSAAAVNALIQAGVQVPLYSMVDGFEGDKNDAGRRNVNGWKNVGAKWTYKIRDRLLFTAQ